jgi:hypothetical protein
MKSRLWVFQQRQDGTLVILDGSLTRTVSQLNRNDWRHIPSRP